MFLQQTEDGNVGRGRSGTSHANSVSSSSAKSTPRIRPTAEESHIGKYRLAKTIGKGNFAKVKLAKHVPTDKEVGLCDDEFFSNFCH